MTAFRKFGDYVESYRNGYGKRPVPGESGPIVLRIADVSSGTVSLSSPRCGVISEKDALTYRLQAGDLLFIRVNGAREIVGRCCVIGHEVPPDTVFNDHLIRARLKTGIDPEFARLCVGLPAARAIIEEAAATSAGQLTIGQEVLSSISIPCLPLSSQKQLVARVKARLVEVETARQAAQAQIGEIEALRAAVYRDAFRQIVPISLTKSVTPPGSNGSGEN